MQIAPYVGGKSSAGKTSRIIKLSSNESALGASPMAVEAYKALADRLHRYPDGHATALREAIAEVYQLPAERIVCGAGSDELIGLLINAYTGEEDEVLYPEHGFLMYKIYAQGAGATPVTAPEKDLKTDVDALLAKVSVKTKLVFVANPNNPTGSYISASELKRLREGLPPHVLMVVDAAYSEYVQEPDYSDGRALVDTTENTVMLRTFSKIYGLPALRLGWGYMPAHVADVLNRVRGPFNVSAAAIAAGIAAVKDVGFVQKAIQHNAAQLAWLSNECTALGLHPYPSVGNFLLVKFPAGAKSAANANLHLLNEGIIVRETANYGLGDCLRITVGTEDENKALVAALRAFMR